MSPVACQFQRHPVARRATALVGALLLVGGVTTTALAAAGGSPSPYQPIQRTNIDRSVPAGSTLLPSGRLVTPAGRGFNQGDFPLGVAVSPDGVVAVATGVGQGDGTPAGNFGAVCLDGRKKPTCSVPTDFGGPKPTPDEALFVTNLVTGAYSQVRAPQSRCAPNQTPPSPTLNCFELGVVFSPDGKHVYAVGGGNDAIYDFPVDTATDTVASTPAHTTYLQEVNTVPGGQGTYQKPNPGTQAARTKGLAITPDGSTLLVAKEQAGALDVVRASDLGFVQEVSFGPLNPTGANGSVSYPYQVATSPDGSKAYVTLQGTGALATVPLTSLGGTTTAGTPVQVPAGDHPTGVAVSPDGSTIMVANANDDTVSVVPTTAGVPAAGTRIAVHAKPGEVYGASPNAVAFDGNDRAYVALAGDDAVATLTRPAGGSFAVAGLTPTGWYPTSVAVRPGTHEVLALAAKGLGSRYTDSSAYPPPPAGGPQADLPYYYDGSNMPGLLSLFPSPSATDLTTGTTTVRRDIDFAGEAAGTPHGPIPTSDATAGQSPVTHVVYIVRENRTYDQEYGDLATTRNDSDADPSLQQLAPATPNGHAVTNRYASSDSFFSDGEASIQGHYWTTSANVDDYVEKSWRQYYSSRAHSSDSVGTNISAPKDCSIFQAAQAKQASTPGFTYMDFGDPVGVFNPTSAPGAAVPGQGPNPTGANPAGTLGTNGCGAIPATNTDLTNFGNFLGLDDRDSASRFLTDSGLNPDGTPIAGAAATLRNFNYLELPLDHTTGFTPQGPTNINGHTPRAQVAENDAAVGNVLSALSRSSYWPSTAVFVVEDDSQDGPDHVDGHRNVLLAASPYARQQSANGCYAGYISHVHTDQASVLRTMELMLGLPSLSSYDQNAPPLYDLFQDKSTAADLTSADLAPYQQPAPAPFVEEKVGDPSAGTAAQQHALEQESAHLNLSAIDKAGPLLEDVLWKSTHLGGAAPPPGLQAELAHAGQAAEAEAVGATDAVALDRQRAQAAALRQRFTQQSAAATDCTPTVSASPTPVVPETRWAVGLPLVAVAAGVGLLVVSRRRRDVTG